jgi:hypothetical protein
MGRLLVVFFIQASHEGVISKRIVENIVGVRLHAHIAEVAHRIRSIDPSISYRTLARTFMPRLSIDYPGILHGFLKFSVLVGLSEGLEFLELLELLETLAEVNHGLGHAGAEVKGGHDVHAIHYLLTGVLIEVASRDGRVLTHEQLVGQNAMVERLRLVFE